MRHRVTPSMIDAAALDCVGLNLRRYPSAGTRQPGPVIVVHGAALRLNLDPPSGRTTLRRCFAPVTPGVLMGRFDDKSALRRLVLEQNHIGSVR